jgi:predicted site-specific integrase-resolvase
MDTPKEWMTVKDAAEHLQVCAASIRTYLRRGVLTGYKGPGKNGKMYVSRKSIEALGEPEDAK